MSSDSSSEEEPDEDGEDGVNKSDEESEDKVDENNEESDEVNELRKLIESLSFKDIFAAPIGMFLMHVDGTSGLNREERRILNKFYRDNEIEDVCAQCGEKINDDNRASAHVEDEKGNKYLIRTCKGCNGRGKTTEFKDFTVEFNAFMMLIEY